MTIQSSLHQLLRVHGASVLDAIDAETSLFHPRKGSPSMRPPVFQRVCVHWDAGAIAACGGL